MGWGRRRDGTGPGCTRSLNSLQPDILTPSAPAVQGKSNIRPPVSTLWLCFPKTATATFPGCCALPETCCSPPRSRIHPLPLNLGSLGTAWNVVGLTWQASHGWVRGPDIASLWPPPICRRTPGILPPEVTW